MCVLEIQHSRYTQPRSRAKNMMFLYVTRELLHGFPFNLKPCWISSCCIELQSLGSKTLAVVEISPIAVLAAAPILKRNTFLGISLELLHGFSFKLQQCWISSCCIELQSLGSKTLAVVEISPIAVSAAVPSESYKHDVSLSYSGTAAWIPFKIEIKLDVGPWHRTTKLGG